MARTLEDLLTDARACTTAEAALAILDDSFVKAASYELRSIASAAAEMATVTDAMLVGILDRVLARALDEYEQHAVFEVAHLRVSRLGDAAGAHAAIDACVTRLAEPDRRSRSYEWVQLAAQLARLGDRAGMIRVLTLGRDRARGDADELVDIAREWATEVDREEGIALLREAERADPPPPAWSLANAWRALELPDESGRVLDAALAKATTASEALHVLNAARSHDDGERVRTAFTRGETLATDARDWLELGEAAFESELGVDVIRRALVRAEALEPDDRAIDRIAAGYRSWLLDHVAAARFGERDVLAADYHARLRELGEPVSANALFDWLRERATPELLERIAGADYGSDFAKHLAALQVIASTGRLPRALGWEPHEALALTRWSDGDKVDHLERAFACVILCITEPDELVTNGAILLESCLALGAEPTHLAALLFAWSCEIADLTVLPVATLLAVVAAPELEPAAIRLLDMDATELADTVFTSMRGELWRALIAERLVPLRTTAPAIDHFLAQLLPD